MVHRVLVEEVRHRVSVMQGVPAFLRGLLRNAIKTALESISAARRSGNSEVALSRAWKLFLLVSRMVQPYAAPHDRLSHSLGLLHLLELDQTL